MLAQLSSQPSLDEQTFHLTSQACDASLQPDKCREVLRDSWPDMGTCLYKAAITSDMICQHFGDCLYNSHQWECADIGHLLARVLKDPPFIVITAKDQLKNCFCQSDLTSHEDLLPAILPSLSDWVTSKTDWICSTGSDTCTDCMRETGKQVRTTSQILYLHTKIR